jgi:hypothetical protein
LRLILKVHVAEAQGVTLPVLPWSWCYNLVVGNWVALRKIPALRVAGGREGLHNVLAVVTVAHRLQQHT